jgi:tetratricopeptide (TPR) repeat protein
MTTKYYSLTCFLSSAFAAYAASAVASAAPNSGEALDTTTPRYQSCITEVEISPQSAYEAASNWRRQLDDAAARHCEALALIELGLHKQGAKQLQAMAAAEATGTTHMRANLYAQAGNAWLLSGNTEAALANFTAGLALDPLKAWIRSDLYVDRGRTHAQARNLKDAEADYTQALEILPHHIEAIILRAGIRRQNDDPRGALADLEFALADNPQNPDALVERGLLKKQLLDPVGARADFQAVIAIAPNSAAAAIARNGINKLNIHGRDDQ